MEPKPSECVSCRRPLRRVPLLSNLSAIAALMVFAWLGAARAQDSPTNIVVQFGVTSGTASERRLTVWIGLDVTFLSQGARPTGTVEYATVDGTAKGGMDYVPLQGTYYYYPDQSPLQPYIVVNLMEDTEAEPDEYFFLTLRNPQNGAALGSKTNLMIIIRDNDSVAGPGLGPDTGALFNGFYSDNGALLTGYFRAVDGVARAGIARLNPDNTLDQSFQLAPENCRQQRGTGAVQRDGKILLGGCVTNAENQQLTSQSLLRVTSEGTLDATFNVQVLSGCCDLDAGPIRHIVVQPDGRIVISGYFTNVNGIARAGVARLEQDGSVDAGFVADPDIGNAELTLLSNGKYLGLRMTRDVIRLHANGSRDATFNLETNGYCGVQPWVTAVQPDGKVLAGGSYCLGGPGRFKTLVMRYTANGSMDPSFIGTNDFTGGNGLTALALQPDGKVLVGGSFERVNGVARSSLARLNPDGSVDENFPTAPGGVTFVGVRADEKIFLCGWFTNVAGVPRYYVALLNPDGTLVCNAHPRSPALLSSGEFQFSLRGYEEGAYTIDASTDFQHWTAIQTNTSGNVLLNFTDPIPSGNSLRFFRTRVLAP